MWVLDAGGQLWVPGGGRWGARRKWGPEVTGSCGAAISKKASEESLGTPRHWRRPPKMELGEEVWFWGAEGAERSKTADCWPAGWE